MPMRGKVATFAEKKGRFPMMTAKAIALALAALSSAPCPAQSMEGQGLVNVRDLDGSIFVSLMYSRADNFTGAVLYDTLRTAYLHPSAAEALARASDRLRELRPDLALMVCDAARPMSVQQRMWDRVKGTPKDIYVSNPANGGGMHNYGLAVDVTLCTLEGDSIPMGTLVDHMGPESHIDREDALVGSGAITRQERLNRELLREVMRYAGFKPLRTEWWHFNLVSRETAKRHYRVIR